MAAIRARGAPGQSTIEYAVVFAAFVTVVIALGAMAKMLAAGLVIEHALQAASHHIAAAGAMGWIDALLY